MNEWVRELTHMNNLNKKKTFLNNLQEKENDKCSSVAPSDLNENLEG